MCPLLPHDSVEERYSAGAEAGEDVAAIGCEEIAVGRPRDARAGAPPVMPGRLLVPLIGEFEASGGIDFV